MQVSADGTVRRFRVLIVDDEPELVALIADVLSTLPEPPSVAVAENGQAAVEAVRQQAPDLVFLDMNMPIMNGLDALKHIRQLDPTLPVLLLTGADARTASAGLAAGAFGYVPKPMNLHYMAHLVDLALRSRERPRGGR